MRLAQLSRKLKVKSSDIIQFLEDQGLMVDSGSNVKISNEHVELVVKEYGDLRVWKEELEAETRKKLDEENLTEATLDIESQAEPQPKETELPIEEKIEKADCDTEIVSETREEILNDSTDGGIIVNENESADVDNSDVSSKEENSNVSNEEVLSPPPILFTGLQEEQVDTKEIDDVVQVKSEDSENEPETTYNIPSDRTDDEVIKAPKISLPGLKIVGKIELPKPKEKEEVKEIDSEPRNEKPRKKNTKGKKGKEKGEWVNTLELKRQRQKEREEKRALALKKRLKEEKRKHYLNKVENTYQVASPIQKKKNKAAVKGSQRDVNTKEKKGIIKRFIKWLNT